ncbi:methylenetetrahydrofolate reductase [NAD(P)H] [Pelistega sp. NLN82]|uniref:Methylenetetrahydrofolate reductase n=1 Tax=Pelistega ratti TaxID=2652177 RepID=A0A6L9Y3V4_9BURK|nr:methylenetetrahydrofolate reductase [NAD(P)H] [Pelistega ratti]NEN74825.1 methylenetetrahydrofolate reductase [NAD(P)H] [Pelistega ratti]
MARDNFFSVEFFPPRDVAAAERLQKTTQELQVIRPSYMSVTFGAGGSTQVGTIETVRMLKNRGLEAVPHLSCVGNTPEQILAYLEQFKQIGVTQLVALRGDLPSGMGLASSELRHASDLVAFIRQHYGDYFNIKVAAYPEMHPQATSPSEDLDHFITKVNAGADSAITQYFYNPDAYDEFVNRLTAKGVTIPVYAGIMPITNYSQLSRFSQMCGAEIPRWIRLRLAEFGDDQASIRAFGIDVVTQLCQKLIDNGVPGIHFYTLNQSKATLAIWQNLKI